ncbi:MAG: ARPP-1 family domain-containing protein [Aggregatilineales bacterium]
MNQLAAFLNGVSVGMPQTYENMTVYPLLAKNGHTRTYQTLDEALAAKTFEVSEVSEGGSVPTLMVHNRGDLPVLLVIGEELIGAKQNRVLNTSMLVAAHNDLKIPVSCVERGRWAYRSRTFDSSVTTSHFYLRKAQTESVTANLRNKATYDADQTAVWREVDRKMAAVNTISTTSALHDAYVQSEAKLEAYLGAFAPGDSSHGFIVSINGEVVGGDLFDHPDTLRKLWPKLMRSYALDALERASRPAISTPGITDTQEFISKAQSAHDEIYESVGLGRDVRLSSEQVSGSGLLWNDHLVHASLFNAKV